MVASVNVHLRPETESEGLLDLIWKEKIAAVNRKVKITKITKE